MLLSVRYYSYCISVYLVTRTSKKCPYSESNVAGFWHRSKRIYYFYETVYVMSKYQYYSAYIWYSNTSFHFVQLIKYYYDNNALLIEVVTKIKDRKQKLFTKDHTVINDKTKFGPDLQGWVNRKLENIGYHLVQLSTTKAQMLQEVINK